jgi:hypothetical protein
VFTLPAEMAAIAAQNNAVVYSILFRTVAETFRAERLVRRQSDNRCRSSQTFLGYPAIPGLAVLPPPANQRGGSLSHHLSVPARPTKAPPDYRHAPGDAIQSP